MRLECFPPRVIQEGFRKTEKNILGAGSAMLLGALSKALNCFPMSFPQWESSAITTISTEAQELQCPEKQGQS